MFAPIARIAITVVTDDFFSVETNFSDSPTSVHGHAKTAVFDFKMTQSSVFITLFKGLVPVIFAERKVGKELGKIIVISFFIPISQPFKRAFIEIPAFRRIFLSKQFLMLKNSHQHRQMNAIPATTLASRLFDVVSFFRQRDGCLDILTEDRRKKYVSVVNADKRNLFHGAQNTASHLNRQRREPVLPFVHFPPRIATLNFTDD